MRLGLISCSLQKLAGARPAEYAYTSRVFKVRKLYVRNSCDMWYILSGYHGLLHPATTIDGEYDIWLRHISVAERRKWQSKVANEVLELEPTYVQLHAGRHYTDPVLVNRLEAAGVEVEQPTRGLTNPQTFSELKRQLMEKGLYPLDV